MDIYIGAEHRMFHFLVRASESRFFRVELPNRVFSGSVVRIAIFPGRASESRFFRVELPNGIKILSGVRVAIFWVERLNEIKIRSVVREPIYIL